jgi:hypothetical protein
MGYFFRRSAKLGPFRLNFSKSGVGASVGVTGARLTMTPRGTTYITVGRNGFYYRETISSRPRSSQPPSVPHQVDRASSGEIPTADVSELVDSSSEQLVNTLNERAKMFNPAWLVYIAAVLLFVFAIGSQPETNGSTTSTTPLAGANYPTLVARYGYPNSVLASKALGAVTVRTAFYTAANVGLVLVQEPCISAYARVTAVLSDQKKYPALAEDEMKDLHPCLGPPEAGWSVQRYIDSEDKADITTEWARDHLAGLMRKETTPPPIEIEKRTRATTTSGRTTKKTVPGRELWSVPDGLLHSIQERDQERDAKAAAAVAWQMYSSYGLMVTGLAVFVLGIVVNKKNADKRMSRLFYELSEGEAQRYSVVQQALAHLAKAHQLWRVEADSPTSDWKRNAGASSLVRRVLTNVGTSTPPRVQTNIQTPSLDVGRIRLYFMPDLILYWDHGTFGSVSYDDFLIEQGTTRFIEDGYVPSDAAVVGNTWRYVRRDGGPDRRFNNNRQLSIAQYGTLGLRSSRGLNIYLQVSSLDAAAAFANCFRERSHRAPRIEAQDATAQVNRELPSGPEEQARKMLGVGNGASSDEIGASYRRLAQMYHPDKVAGLAPEFQVLADRRMKEINAAHELLKRNTRASPPMPTPSNSAQASGTLANETDIDAAFVGESEKARALAKGRGQNWEYLLTEEVLRGKLSAVREHYNSFDAMVALYPHASFGRAEYLQWMVTKLEEFQSLVHRVIQAVKHGMPTAWGKPGGGGNAIQILRAAENIAASCEALLNWELEVAATDPPGDLKRPSLALRGIGCGILNEVQRVPDELAKAVAEGGNYKLSLNFDVPQMDAFNREFETATALSPRNRQIQ